MGIWVKGRASTPAAHAFVVFFNINGNTSSITTIQQYLDPRDEAMSVFPNRDIQRITHKQLPKILKYRAKINPRTVVISGHHGGGRFSGINGELLRADLKEYVERFPNFFSHEDNLVLRGCYTATIKEVATQNGWHTRFANADFIAGYERKAWSSETVYSREFMQYALALKPKLNGNDTDSLQALKQFPNYDKSAYAFWYKALECLSVVTEEKREQSMCRCFQQ